MGASGCELMRYRATTRVDKHCGARGKTLVRLQRDQGRTKLETPLRSALESTCALHSRGRHSTQGFRQI